MLHHFSYQKSLDNQWQNTAMADMIDQNPENDISLFPLALDYKR